MIQSERERIDPDGWLNRPHVYKGGPPPARLRRAQRGQETLARRAGVEWDIVDFREVYRKDAGICARCGQVVDLEDMAVRHPVSFARGGAHVLSNLQLTHRRCPS